MCIENETISNSIGVILDSVPGCQVPQRLAMDGGGRMPDTDDTRSRFKSLVLGSDSWFLSRTQFRTFLSVLFLVTSPRAANLPTYMLTSYH